MRKLIKIIFIVLFYVFMFWGLGNGIKAILHKTNDCNCDVSKEVVAVEVTLPNEKIEVEEEPKIEKEKKEEPKPVKTEPVIKATGAKAEYQAFAYDLVINQYIWSEEDFKALVNLWTKESDWNPNAVNKSSGACNIPQALPCNKISNAYGDNSWQSGIKWGLKYIKQRYGTPTGAWQHFQNKGWY